MKFKAKKKIIIKLSYFSDDCKLNRKIGNSYLKAYNFTIKWYYKFKLKKCIQFHYTGKGGNANNFDNCFDCFNRCFLVIILNLIFRNKLTQFELK